MLDELDLLKKNWKNIDNSFNQVSENQLYTMIHKRSSNIVKWILIISLLELLVYIFSTLYFKTNQEYQLNFSKSEKNYYLVMEIISYAILLYFIIKFYLNYKKIRFDSTSKELLKSIVKTRKTVEIYVKIIIGYSILSSFLFVGLLMYNHGEIQSIINKFEDKGGMFLLYLILFFICIFVIIFIYFILWGFYKILYGLLLNKLMKNYNEIKQMEM